MNTEDLLQELRNAQKNLNGARLALQYVWTKVDYLESDTDIYLLTEQLCNASLDIHGALQILGADDD